MSRRCGGNVSPLVAFESRPPRPTIPSTPSPVPSADAADGSGASENEPPSTEVEAALAFALRGRSTRAIVEALKGAQDDGSSRPEGRRGITAFVRSLFVTNAGGPAIVIPPGADPMSAASSCRELARWSVALAVALALGQGCGGSVRVSAVGDAAPDTNGSQGIAADGSSLEAATQDATSEATTSTGDASPGADAATGIDGSPDASAEGASEDSVAPPTSDAAAYDAASDADAGTSAEDSGEPSSDATSTACGTTGLACCPGDQCDATGLWCVAGTCVACGNPGAPCCGTTCNAGNICFAIGSVSQCQACGQPGQPCCTTEPACGATGNAISGDGLCWCTGGGAGEPGGSCTSTCSDPGYACWFGACVECGDLAEPCCGSTCSSSLSCSAGSCQ
jgi:hypothetical protein